MTSLQTSWLNDSLTTWICRWFCQCTNWIHYHYMSLVKVSSFNYFNYHHWLLMWVPLTTLQMLQHDNLLPVLTPAPAQPPPLGVPSILPWSSLFKYICLWLLMGPDRPKGLSKLDPRDLWKFYGNFHKNITIYGNFQI